MGFVPAPATQPTRRPRLLHCGSTAHRRPRGAVPPTPLPLRVLRAESSENGSDEGVNGRGDGNSSARRKAPVPLPELWRLAHNDPKSGRLWMAIAKKEKSAERKRKALRLGLEHNERNEFLWHMLGMTEQRENNLELAEEYFRTGIQKCERGSRAALFQAMALLHKRKHGVNDEVFALLRRGLEEDPTHGPIFVALANIYIGEGCVAKARETFESGASACPKHGPLWRAWATLEEQRGHPYASREKWQRSVEVDPHEHRAWLSYAQLELQIGGDRGAAAVLRNALLAMPRRTEIRVMLAKVLESSGDIGVARSVLEEGARKDESGTAFDGDSVLLRALAALEANDGNIARARAIYERMLTDRNGHSSVHSLDRSMDRIKTMHAWALFESRMGAEDKAREILLQATSIVPSDSGIWRAIGELETRLRNFEVARVAYQRAVSGAPDDARLWLAWGRMEAAAGRLSRAEELYTRASTLKGDEGGAGAKGGGTVGGARAGGGMEAEGDVDAGSLGDHHGVVARHTRASQRVRADALRELAGIALRAGEFERSRDLLRAVVKVDPFQLLAWRELGEMEGKVGGESALRSTYDRAFKLLPRSTHAKLYHWLGLEMRRSGDTATARRMFEEAVKVDRLYVSVWISRALMEKDVGQVEQACKLMEEAADIAAGADIKVPFLYTTWGRMLDRDAGDVRAAREVFERGIALHPTYSGLFLAWGQLEERQGDVAAARRLYANACDVEPDNGAVWQSRALLECRQRRHDVARQYFVRGAELDPQNAALLAAHASVEGRQMGNVTFARELFRRATAADANYATAWHAWGTMEAAVGNVEAAKNLYMRAVKADKRDPASWHALGMLHRNLGDVEYARTCFKSALEVDPLSALTYQAWALMEARDANGGGVDEARGLLGQAMLKLLPKNGWQVWQAHAILAAKDGRMDEARSTLQEAIARAPRCTELYRTWAEIERDARNFDEARRCFELGASESTRDAAPIYTAWGKMEAECGEIERARELFRRGIDANPSHEAAWRTYASVEESVGNSEEAQRLRVVAAGIISDALFSDSHEASS